MSALCRIHVCLRRLRARPILGALVCMASLTQGAPAPTISVQAVPRTISPREPFALEVNVRWTGVQTGDMGELESLARSGRLGLRFGVKPPLGELKTYIPLIGARNDEAEVGTSASSVALRFAQTVKFYTPENMSTTFYFEKHGVYDVQLIHWKSKAKSNVVQVSVRAPTEEDKACVPLFGLPCEYEKHSSVIQSHPHSVYGKYAAAYTGLRAFKRAFETHDVGGGVAAYGPARDLLRRFLPVTHRTPFRREVLFHLGYAEVLCGNRAEGKRLFETCLAEFSYGKYRRLSAKAVKELSEGEGKEP